MMFASRETHKEPVSSAHIVYLYFDIRPTGEKGADAVRCVTPPPPVPVKTPIRSLAPPSPTIKLCSLSLLLCGIHPHMLHPKLRLKLFPFPWIHW